MSTPDKPPPSEDNRDEMAALLKRILQAVERDSRKQWLEIACAVVLSLATTASAWCAYQSSVWGGVETFQLAAASQAGRDASAASLAAVQTQAFDASMFIDYLQAKSQGNKELEQILYHRFRPGMKAAVVAWLKTDPFNDHTAPPGPFKMAEYDQPESDEAKHQEKLFSECHAAAQQASKTSDTYVLLTVLCSAVLFFGGIGGTFQSQRSRTGVFVIAIVLFVATLLALVTLPIAIR